MNMRLLSYPISLFPASMLLIGCLDITRNPGTQDDSTLPTAAYSGSQVNLCPGTACGKIPAFLPVSDPNKPFGWALDASTQVPGGFAINRIYYDYSQSRVAVSRRTGGLVDMDIRGNDELWGVNDVGQVFRNTDPGNDNSPWANVPSDNAHPAFSAIKVGAGLNNVFVLSNEPVAGGYKVYKWTGGMSGFPWQLVSGGLIDIDVENNGDLWGLNNNGSIFRLPGGNPNANWELKGQPGVVGTAIACGNGNTYMLNSQKAIMQLLPGNSWITYSPLWTYSGIQVDSDGRLWAGTAQNYLRTWTGI